TPATAWLVAFVGGLASGLFLLPFWVRPFISAAERGNAADWIGFAGNFAAGIMTLIAAMIAWFSVQRQIAKGEAAKLQSQHEAKTVAIVVLTKAIHAASAILYAVQIASAANTPAAVSNWDQLIKQTSVQLGKTLDHFAVQQIASEM